LRLDQQMYLFTGSGLTLSAGEQLVDNLLKDAIMREINEGIEKQNFAPSKNFMLSKKDIESSEVFALIKNMPKGMLTFRLKKYNFDDI